MTDFYWTQHLLPSEAMETAKNLSAVLMKKGDLQVVDRPVPEPGNGEVQVRVHSVGICGSDVHYWQNGEIGDFVVRGPMVLGHEACGTVTKLGPGVQHLKIGDRVAIEPAVPCRLCKYCKGGRYNLCKDMACCATPPYHGSLSRYYVHAADFCFKLADNMSMEEGALLEPLSVGIHACRRGGVSLGSMVLVCGAGPIGLVNILTAKAMGAAKVIVTDIDAGRLAVAKSLGADSTLLVDTKDAKVLAEKIENLLGEAPNISIECSGAPASITLAIKATASGGCVVLVGLGPPVVELPVVDAAVREVDIRGLFRYLNCYPTAMAMVASGKIDVKPLVTHRFTLEESLQAFELTRSGADGAIKVMIKCSTE